MSIEHVVMTINLLKSFLSTAEQKKRGKTNEIK